jgi:hypothetical protein
MYRPHSSANNKRNIVRFEVFTAVTEEWCLLGCYAVWLL